MLLKKLCILFVLEINFKIAFSVDYCSLNCTRVGKTGAQNTICNLNNKCDPGPACGTPVRVGLTFEQKKIVLDVHNKYRNKIALGKESGQPTASNMRELIWNDALEETAQCWANQCIFEHDECRRTEKFGSVGQNLALTTETSMDVGIVKRLLGLWYNEVRNIVPRSGTKYPPSNIGKIGHFTQMVWADTDHLGCALIVYHDTYLVCNYGAAGNVLGRNYYRTGRPCAHCPPGHKRHHKYKGLCTRKGVNGTNTQNRR